MLHRHPASSPCGASVDAFFGDGAWFAYALAPVARYEPSLSRALGKWLLSLATNSRLFWPNALPPSQQCNADDPRDPDGVLPYEAARHCLYYRPWGQCLGGDAGDGPIGTGDVCELRNCTDDPWKFGKGRTDRGLYGGIFAGILGALVVPTSEPLVPAFDVLATDPWPAADPPAAALLLYNPLPASSSIFTLTARIKTKTKTKTGGGSQSFDVVDTTQTPHKSWGKVSGVRNSSTGVVSAQVQVSLPADFAALLEFRLSAV